MELREKLRRLGLSGTGYKSDLVTRLSELKSRDVRIIEMEFDILKRELELLKIRSPMTNSARCTNPASDKLSCETRKKR